MKVVSFDGLERRVGYALLSSFLYIWIETHGKPICLCNWTMMTLLLATRKPMKRQELKSVSYAFFSVSDLKTMTTRLVPASNQQIPQGRKS